MSRAVRYERFGGPDVLEVREVAEPHAGSGEVRVRVSAAGLNPMDWGIAARPEAAARFGITLPAGFGSDFAGTVDEVGPDVAGMAVGDRVFGAALGQAMADHVVVALAAGRLWHTPDSVTDEVAGTLAVAGRTAAAAVAAVGPGEGDVVVVGGAAGGVGVLASQLTRRAGARVIGTASAGTADFLRQLGVEPVTYGTGLADRLRALAPDGVTAAIDLFGTDTAETAIELGVPARRIATVTGSSDVPAGVRATGAVDAPPDAMERLVSAIAAGQVTVPIAARYPLAQVRDAVRLQAGRHVHGKVVVTM